MTFMSIGGFWKSHDHQVQHSTLELYAALETPFRQERRLRPLDLEVLRAPWDQQAPEHLWLLVRPAAPWHPRYPEVRWDPSVRDRLGGLPDQGRPWALLVQACPAAPLRLVALPALPSG